MTPEHKTALRVDNEVRRLRSGLDLCSIGLAAWCHRAIAGDTYQRSPSDRGISVRLDRDGNVIHGEEDVKLTGVEAQAFHHPDPLVHHARAFLDAVNDANAARMIRHAIVICQQIPPDQRPDPCRKCGKPIGPHARRGECGSCVKAEQRERERVA